MDERDPQDVVDKGLAIGMAIVAKLYAEQVYRLPEIMMSTKTMEIGVGLAEGRSSVKSPARAEVSLPKTDGPHDIGAKAAEAVMRSSGYGVIDQTPVVVSSMADYIAGRKPSQGTSLMTSTLRAFPGKSVR